MSRDVRSSQRRLVECPEATEPDLVHRRPDLACSPELALFALDHAADAVFMFGRDARLFYVNDRACESLGYRRKELLALRVADINPRFTEPRWLRLWPRVQRVRTATFESSHRRRDGTMFPVEVAATLVGLDGHEYVCASARDIADRRSAEERLRNSEERFRRLVEGSLEGISVDEFDNRPLFVNQAFADMYGYQGPEEVLALDSLQEAVVPEDRERIEQYTVDRKAGRPAPTLYEFQGLRRDGSRIDVLCSVQTVVWDGRPAVQSTSIDITDRKRIQDAERENQAARARLVGAMEASSEGFALFDAEDRLYYSNQRYREMMRSIEDVITPGTSFRDLLEESIRRGGIPEAVGREDEWIDKRVARHRASSEPFELYRADSGMWVRVREQRLADGDTFIVASDITAVKESQRALADKTAQLRAAYENMDQGIVMLDDQYRIVTFNQRLVETLAVTDIELEPGLPIQRVCECFARHGGYGEGDVDEQVERRMQKIRDGKPYRFVVERQDGRFLEVRGRPISSGGHVITHMDITETHQLSRKLSYQANHDALTGLANRSQFECRLEELLLSARRGETHALCYLDLDQFKVINDTCGHLAGDELLRQLGGVLPEQVRHHDTLARLGGDEFGLLLENCGAEDAVRIAEKVRTAVEDFRFRWEDKAFRIGTSIGVVPIDRHSESVSDILSYADTACYAAKDEGGGRVHVYRADDTELARRRGDMQWVADINRSLEQNAFVLCRQPIHNLRDTDDPRVRCEILLRLDDRAGNLFEPRSFLRSAERFGLMVKLDHWVFGSMLNWLGVNEETLAGPATFFINISGVSLRDEGFRSHVIHRLREWRPLRSRLCFEITETAAVASLTSTAEFIDKVRDLGHACALDDFGSGLSSFAYLKNLPVDYVKIDGQFVRDITHDPIDLAMVRSITEVARVMGKQTIAEFAETAPVLERLREVGVDFAQGYAVGLPEPLDAL